MSQTKKPPERPCLLSLKVIPNASRDEISGWQEDGSLKLRIQSPPLDGKANKAVIAFLAKTLGIPKSRLSIERGESSRQKVVAIKGLEHSELMRLLTN